MGNNSKLRCCAKCKLSAACLGGPLEFFKRNREVFAVGFREPFCSVRYGCKLVNSNVKRQQLVGRFVRGEA
jgi:hypothetical protein